MVWANHFCFPGKDYAAYQFCSECSTVLVRKTYKEHCHESWLYFQRSANQNHPDIGCLLLGWTHRRCRVHGRVEAGRAHNKGTSKKATTT